jgi:hypothetical protein
LPLSLAARSIASRCLGSRRPPMDKRLVSNTSKAQTSTAAAASQTQGTGLEFSIARGSILDTPARGPPFAHPGSEPTTSAGP